jgi:hydrogenase expression/formation protein HypC
MRIVEMTGESTAVADLDGSRYAVDLSLVEGASLGDYVIVHAGFAIETLDEEEANERLALFEELARAAMPPGEDRGAGASAGPPGANGGSP